MAITIDGNNLVFTGTVTIGNAVNPSNGVVTLTLTPDGGVGNLPALATGDPGQPPLITLGTVSTLAAGSQATVTWDQTSAGGAGTSSEYTVSFGIPQGQAGSSGATVIGSATDLSGTAAVGDIITVSSLSGSTPSFGYAGFPWGNVYNATSFTTANVTGNGQATLGSISVPAQNSAWYPIVFASAIVNGTVNTVVSLQALLTSPSTGQVVGQCPGMSGTANQRLMMIPGFGSLVGVSGYGAVAANTAAVVYLVAKETAAVSDAWSVNAANVTFTVVAFPVAQT